jgi:mannose-6-phosphate isomerase-like protein (cupin superfamily)
MNVVRFDDVPYVPAGHENPQAPGVWKKVFFTRDSFQAGRIQMVNWARLPGGNAFAGHYHEDMQEIFVILSGEVRIRIGDEEQTLRRGDAVLIGPGEIHQMWNEGRDDVEYLAMGVANGEHGRTVLTESRG